MGIKDNEGYITLMDDQHKTATSLDLKVYVTEDGDISVSTGLYDKNGYVNDIHFTVEEVEALYHFAQIAKRNETI